MTSSNSNDIPSQGKGQGPFSREVPELLEMHLEHLRKSAISMKPAPSLDQFQAALRRELAHHRCPLPAPLSGVVIFPRAFRGRATLIRWRQGDSSPADWADAIRKPHGWCCEIPRGVFLLDLDREGALELLVTRLPHGFGLVQSSPGRYHVWLSGEAPPGQHLGHMEDHILEVHGPGRLATLPPSRHVDTGKPYHWLNRFLGTVPVKPEDLGIVLVERPTRSTNRSYIPAPAGGSPLHELMAQLTGQDGRPQGQEWAFFCPRHDDHHRSLMVNDEKGLFYCYGAGCGFKGNRRTLENLLGLRPRRQRRVRVIAEVKLE